MPAYGPQPIEPSSLKPTNFDPGTAEKSRTRRLFLSKPGRFALTARMFRLVPILLFLSAGSSRAGQILFVPAPGSSQLEIAKISCAARFYGLDLKLLVSETALRSSIGPDTVAVVLSAAELAQIDRDSLLQGLSRRGKTPIPILIADISQSTNLDVLRHWSDGAITGIGSLPDDSTESYVFGSSSDVDGTLSSKSIPFRSSTAFYFQTSTGQNTEVLLNVYETGSTFPVLIRQRLRGIDVFLETAVVHAPESRPPFPYVMQTFPHFASELMFVRYAAGPYGWHAPAPYANFTVDDAWLRRRYGHLDYAALLQEMQQHNFHTTIAFIPWNFDRSQPDVVSIFRAHPERFSVCVHGNNHDHEEFASYDVKPLAGQVANIKQALARMNRFSALTGIPFDPVMVFPHDIAPAQTLAELKRYNFSATINSQDLPDDSTPPDDPLFALRNVTMGYGNFASVKRVSVEGDLPPAEIAVNTFLGNPLLFYAHQGFFTTGINAFDPIADSVNRIQPGTTWTDLGTVARHLYLVRSRPDNEFDVRTFSPRISIQNPLPRRALFHVQKVESGYPAIRSVTFDGRPQSYSLVDGTLQVQLSIPAKQGGLFCIEYQNDLGLGREDLANQSARVAFLRRISDFRDDSLSEIWLGRIIIGTYYGLGPFLTFTLATVVSLLLVVAFFYARRQLLAAARRR